MQIFIGGIYAGENVKEDGKGKIVSLKNWRKVYDKSLSR
jgi:hypothetical protein